MSTDYANAIREATMQAVSQIGLVEDVVVGFEKNHQNFLATIMQERVLSREDLEDLVHARIVTLGKRVLNTQSKEYSSPTFSHHALAYCLFCGELTAEEEALVRYDHGESKNEFMIRYAARDFLEHVIAQLVGEHQKQDYLLENAGVPDGLM